MNVFQLLHHVHVCVVDSSLKDKHIGSIDLYLGDIIIERWIPYGAAAKRKTIVQRAAAAKEYQRPRNIIIQYEPVQVRVVRQFQRLGVAPEDPQAYLQRYGALLLDAQTLVQQARAAGVVEDIVRFHLFSSLSHSSLFVI